MAVLRALDGPGLSILGGKGVRFLVAGSLSIVIVLAMLSEAGTAEASHTRLDLPPGTYHYEAIDVESSEANERAARQSFLETVYWHHRALWSRWAYDGSDPVAWAAYIDGSYYTLDLQSPSGGLILNENAPGPVPASPLLDPKYLDRIERGAVTGSDEVTVRGIAAEEPGSGLLAVPKEVDVSEGQDGRVVHRSRVLSYSPEPTASPRDELQSFRREGVVFQEVVGRRGADRPDDGEEFVSILATTHYRALCPKADWEYSPTECRIYAQNRWGWGSKYLWARAAYTRDSQNNANLLRFWHGGNWLGNQDWRHLETTFSGTTYSIGMGGRWPPVSRGGPKSAYFDSLGTVPGGSSYRTRNYHYADSSSNSSAFETLMGVRLPLDFT